VITNNNIESVLITNIIVFSIKEIYELHSFHSMTITFQRTLAAESYNMVLQRGQRIALRSKVNDNLILGLRIVDSLFPIGRGQRQLILGSAIDLLQYDLVVIISLLLYSL
jgi:F0F1-type ATP synthase alpha subunit